MDIEKRYCQSCGMPIGLDTEKLLGTNSDNSKNHEYCFYCLKDGEYTVDYTMQQMVDVWVKYTDKYNEYAATEYTPDQLRILLNKRLPRLKRWRQKQETQNIHNQTINEITSYINSHLFEALDSDELAQMSNLSKYYFRRIFKEIVGENVGTYIQRLRLEYIAHKLLSTDMTLSQIAEQTYYQNKFSLSKAFKKHFGISISAYKERYKEIQSAINFSLVPEIKKVQKMHVLYLSVGDAYKSIEEYRRIWKRLIKYTAQTGLVSHNSKYLRISFDDPLITEREKCRFGLGLVISGKIKADNDFKITEIPQGSYAIFRFKGNYTELRNVYKGIYSEWFPDSGYAQRGTISFEIYINTPSQTGNTDELITDIYFPIVKI